MSPLNVDLSRNYLTSVNSIALKQSINVIDGEIYRPHQYLHEVRKFM